MNISAPHSPPRRRYRKCGSPELSPHLLRGPALAAKPLSYLRFRTDLRALGGTPRWGMQFSLLHLILQCLMSGANPQSLWMSRSHIDQLVRCLQDSFVQYSHESMSRLPLYIYPRDGGSLCSPLCLQIVPPAQNHFHTCLFTASPATGPLPLPIQCYVCLLLSGGF